MESRIPVPTDNIFKFYALFGLLLFVFSGSALLFVNSSTNSLLSSAYIELEGLKQIESPTRSEKARIDILERKMEITKVDKKFYVNALGAIAGIAIILMGYGFYSWHASVQPVLDETARVQLEIAKLELECLKRELGMPAKPTQTAATDAPDPDPAPTSQD